MLQETQYQQKGLRMTTKDRVSELREYMAAVELTGKVLIRRDKKGMLQGPGQIALVALKLTEQALAKKPVRLRVIK